MVCSSHEESQVRRLIESWWPRLVAGVFLVIILTPLGEARGDLRVYNVLVGYAEENRLSGRFALVQSAGQLGQRAVSGKQGSWNHRDPR